MKMNPSWFVFFSLMLVSVMLVLSSANWFLMWVGFELGLLSFLPMFTSSYMVIESQIKYFLVQAVGSTLFIMSFMFVGKMFGLLCCMGMILKLGLFPCYQWVPGVMNSLPWEGCLLMATLQKLPAIVILCSLSVQLAHILVVVGSLSILLSGMAGFNQSALRPLMAYSSIAHTGWLTLALVASFKLLGLYFLFYACILSVLFICFKQLFLSKVVSSSSVLKANLIGFLLILNMGGLPPFSMFFLKLCIIMNISGFFYVFPVILLGMVLSIYYYLVLVIPGFSVYWQSEGLKGLMSSVTTQFLFLMLGYPLLLLF